MFCGNVFLSISLEEICRYSKCTQVLLWIKYSLKLLLFNNVSITVLNDYLEKCFKNSGVVFIIGLFPSTHIYFVSFTRKHFVYTTLWCCLCTTLLASIKCFKVAIFYKLTFYCCLEVSLQYFTLTCFDLIWCWITNHQVSFTGISYVDFRMVLF